MELRPTASIRASAELQCAASSSSPTPVGDLVRCSIGCVLRAIGPRPTTFSPCGLRSRHCPRRSSRRPVHRDRGHAGQDRDRGCLHRERFRPGLRRLRLEPERLPVQGQTTIQLRCSPDTVAEIALDARHDTRRTRRTARWSRNPAPTGSTTTCSRTPGEPSTGATGPAGIRSKCVTTGAPKTVTVYGRDPRRAAGARRHLQRHDHGPRALLIGFYSQSGTGQALVLQERGIEELDW